MNALIKFPHKPTDEQAAIVQAAVSSEDSLLISALAGAAKTSTLVLIAEALPKIPILSIAFNKRIADEMKERLPSNVQANTINSIGHRVWATSLGKKLLVNTKKSYEILTETVSTLKGADKSNAYETFADTLRSISSAKLNGYVPAGKFPTANRLILADAFFASFEEEPSGLQISLIDRVIEASIQQGYNGKIDFDDQIFLPTIFGGTFPRFPLVLVDEAQDLSPLNHAMLEKLVTKRIIAVGDRFQSIYGFRGADTNSMDNLQSRFKMREMTLSTSFRCPKEVVRLARARAPNMQYPEWAIDGLVTSAPEWSASAVPDGAAIICRNNAPLFKCAMRLIRLGRGVKLVGTELGPQLVKALKKLGDPKMNQEQTFAAIDQWEAERLRKSRAKAATTDKAECLRVFASFGENLSAAIAYAEHLFSSSGPIQLLSGHKSKGLEWPVVYFLNSGLIPSKWSTTESELDQEENLRYVITTRAKKELHFVQLDGLVE